MFKVLFALALAACGQPVPGPAGAPGANGVNGLNGVDGVDGATGPAGASYTPQPQTYTWDCSAQEPYGVPLGYSYTVIWSEVNILPPDTSRVYQWREKDSLYDGWLEETKFTDVILFGDPRSHEYERSEVSEFDAEGHPLTLCENSHVTDPETGELNEEPNEYGWRYLTLVVVQ